MQRCLPTKIVVDLPDPSWVELLISPIGTLIAGLLAIIGGVVFYYRRREYELVQRRYLVEGIDVLVATAAASLNTFSDNWSEALSILKKFREVPDVSMDDLHVHFRRTPENRFALIANYRVQAIVGSDLVWSAYQLVLSFCDSARNDIQHDMMVAIQLKLTTDNIEASKEEICETYLAKLLELNEESKTNYIFVGELSKVAALFEQQKFKFASLSTLRDHKVVKDVLATLQETFGDRLTQYQDAHPEEVEPGENDENTNEANP